jgi:hypothetical protein
MQDASKINDVSSTRASVDSLIQQINDKYPGCITTASRMLAVGREFKKLRRGADSRRQ